MPFFKNYLFKILSLMESKLQYAQGKGYGAGTIKMENDLVHKLLRVKPLLAIDIGGNVGEYSAELRRRSEGLEIHIFEPASANLIKLNQRFESDENVHILAYAVSDKNESAILYSDVPGSGLGSLTQRRLDHFNIEFDVREQVKVIRFEDYWRNILKCRTLDIVKIDIEGHELNALNGFGDAINKVRLLQFEFGGCNIDTRSFFQDYWYYFKEKGFDLYRITPFGAQEVYKYKEADEFFSTTNYIAVNNFLTSL